MHQAGVIAHLPFEQSFEQHSTLPPHALPADLHPGLRGAHLPLLQVPPQQEVLLVHASLSLTHAVSEQLPFSQRSEQQVVLDVHATPPALQPPMGPGTPDVHKCVVASHLPVQH